MSNKLITYLVQGNFFRHGFDFFDRRLKVDSAIGWLTRKIYYGKPKKIKNNRIFVMSYDKDFSCNPRYIVEELIRQNKDVEIYSVYDNEYTFAETRRHYPPEVKLVEFRTKAMYDAMATSKIWIDNALNMVWYGMPKSKGQYYLNTWHGSLGIKRLGGNRKWMNRAAKANKVTDYCITNSTFEENVFRETFWKDVPFLKFGHARNDIFFNEERMKEKRRKVERYFDIDGGNEKLIVLYAPTFRENSSKFVPLNFESLKKALEKKYNKEVIIIVRAHNKDRAAWGFEENEWLKDGSFYGDMQELLPGIDIGISDYSSWVFDFMLTNRPIFLYTPDLELYDQERGFYYSIDTTPFPVAKSQSELEKAITDFEEASYRTGVKAFLDDKGCYEEGKACERIVEELDKLMSE